MTDSTSTSAGDVPEGDPSVRARLSIDSNVTLISVALGLSGPAVLVEVDPESTGDAILLRIRAGGLDDVSQVSSFVETASMLLQTAAGSGEIEPTDEQVLAFQQAWAEADLVTMSTPGARTRAGLRAALNA